MHAFATVEYKTITKQAHLFKCQFYRHTANAFSLWLRESNALAHKQQHQQTTSTGVLGLVLTRGRGRPVQCHVHVPGDMVDNPLAAPRSLTRSCFCG